MLTVLYVLYVAVPVTMAGALLLTLVIVAAWSLPRARACTSAAAQLSRVCRRLRDGSEHWAKPLRSEKPRAAVELVSSSRQAAVLTAATTEAANATDTIDAAAAPGRLGLSHPAGARARRLAPYVGLGMLLLALGFLMILPSTWWHERRHAYWARLDSPLLPGKRALPVLAFGCLPVLAAWLALWASPKHARPSAHLEPTALACCHAWPWPARWRPSRGRLPVWRLPALEAAALLLWLLPLLAWHYLRWRRFDGLAPDWASLKHASLTMGLTAVLNLQLLLLPVSHSSPLLRLLGAPSDRLIGWHRWLGKAVVLLVLLHGAYFVAKWMHEGELWAKLAEMGADDEGVWFSDTANLPGVVAAVAGVLIGVTSLPCVRRRAFEAFAYSHRPLALAFFVGGALHWNGLVYYTLPSLLLYLSDAATHATTRLRPAVRVLHARHRHGVISLELGCTRWLRAPQPLQWVLVQAPTLSAMQWHAFSVAAVRPATDEQPASFSLAIRVVRGGWTDALRAWLATSSAHSKFDGMRSTGGCCGDADGCSGDADGSSEGASPVAAVAASTTQQPTLRVAGWYGLGFDVEACLRRGRPLVFVCGGSGGVPCAALLRQIATLLASRATTQDGIKTLGRTSSSPPGRAAAPITLLWSCQTAGQLHEYVRATGLLATAEGCAALRVHLYASQSAANEADEAARADEKGAYSVAFAGGSHSARRRSWRLPLSSMRSAVQPTASPSDGEAGKQDAGKLELMVGRSSSSAPPAELGGGASPAPAALSAPPSQSDALAAYCHVCVPLAVLGALARAATSMPGYQPASLLAVLIGALAGTLSAHALHLAHQLLRPPLGRGIAGLCGHSKASKSTATVSHISPTLSPTERSLPSPSESAGEHHVGLSDVSLDEPADDETQRVFWHTGRPNVDAAMADCAQRLDATDLGTSPRAALVLASGPPGLVRAAGHSAWQNGFAFESISFEL